MLATCGNIALSPLAAGDGTFVSVACLIATSTAERTNLFEEVAATLKLEAGLGLALLQAVRSMSIHW